MEIIRFTKIGDRANWNAPEQISVREHWLIIKSHVDVVGGLRLLFPTSFRNERYTEKELRYHTAPQPMHESRCSLEMFFLGTLNFPESTRACNARCFMYTRFSNFNKKTISFTQSFAKVARLFRLSWFAKTLLTCTTSCSVTLAGDHHISHNANWAIVCENAKHWRLGRFHAMA